MRKPHWPYADHLGNLQSSTHLMLSTGTCLRGEHASLLNAVCWTIEIVTAFTRLQGCTFVNQYVVVKTLGQGAYGKVKLCLNSEDHNLYALKLVSKVGTTELTFLSQSCRQPEVTVWPSCGELQSQHLGCEMPARMWVRRHSAMTVLLYIVVSCLSFHI